MNEEYIEPGIYDAPTEEAVYENVESTDQEYPAYDYGTYDTQEYQVYDYTSYEEYPVYEEAPAEAPQVDGELPVAAPPASSSDLVPFQEAPASSSDLIISAETPVQAQPARVTSSAERLALEGVEATEEPEETPRLFLDTPFSDYTVAEGLLLSLLLVTLISALVLIVKEGFSWL